MLMSNKMIFNIKKKQYDKDNKDEVQEITAVIIPIKKKKAVCVTCNKTCVTKNGF